MPALDTSLGCFFIGVVVSTVLYGCTLAQMVYYVSHYPEDRGTIRVFVFCLWAFDTLSTIFGVVLIWAYLVTGHADLAKLTKSPFSGIAEYLIVLVIILMVHAYYIRSIWKLIKQNLYKVLTTSIVVMISLVSFAFGLDNAYNVIRNPTIPEVYTKTEVSATVQPLLACIADIYISVALSLLLQRKRTMFRRTDILINTLTMWAINRGLLTAALQTAESVSYIAANKADYYWFIFDFASAKAYVNSAIAILNARNYIRGGGRTYQVDDFSVQEIPMNLFPSQSGSM